MLFFPDLDGPNTKQVEMASAVLAAHEAALEKQKADAIVACKYCAKTTPIKELHYRQTHWYESPHGCNGGDHWHELEGSWLCMCGIVNRLYDQPEVSALKKYFKEVVNHFDRNI